MRIEAVSHTVLLVRHSSPRRCEDRVAQLLAQRGYALELCNVAAGHALPDSGDRYACAVIYGGIQSANDSEKCAHIRREIDWIAGWVGRDRPLFGICLGAQLLARALGARVGPHDQGRFEIGYTRIRPTSLAQGFLDEPLHVYQWHSEGFEVPPGAELLATGDVFRNQAFRYGVHAYGIQFHPEVTPGVLREWIGEAAHMLNQPGSHCASRQLADSARFDAPMARWLESFFERWSPQWPPA